MPDVFSARPTRSALSTVALGAVSLLLLTGCFGATESADEAEPTPVSVTEHGTEPASSVENLDEPEHPRGPLFEEAQ